MHRFLSWMVAGLLVTGCVDRRVDSDPPPVFFESANLEVSGLRAVDSGFVAYGQWREDQDVMPAIVWLNRQGALDLEQAEQGIWQGPAVPSVEDVFVGITSFEPASRGNFAVETTFDGSIRGTDTRNTIWKFDQAGEVEPSFALDGRLSIDEPGGVIGLSASPNGFVAPRATQLDDGLRQVQVDRIGESGDFEAEVGTVDVIEDMTGESCRSACERGFSGFLDMTFAHDEAVYVVGTQIVSFFSDEPVLARVDGDGTWDESFGVDGFLRLAKNQFEGWRVHAAARRDNELAVLLFPPRGEDYRVSVVDLDTGVVSRRFDVVSDLEDIHLDHIAAGESGWWLGGFDFIAENRPNFVLAVDEDGRTRVEFGENGLVRLNRRVSVTGLFGAADDSLLISYQKFGLTRLGLLDPQAPGELSVIDAAQDDQNAR